MLTSEKCAARGARFLDKKHQDWAVRVPLQKFDITSCNSCVVAHLYGDYTRGIRLLGLDPCTAVTAFLGFNAYFDQKGDQASWSPSFEDLQKAWVHEIKKRLLV